MRNASHNRAQAKVAVIPASVSSPEAKRQQLQEQITIALVGLGALVAAGVA
ncbi:MAG: hypothetical protein ABG776_16705 [Cyanobacteria bacterium J06555_13]